MTEEVETGNLPCGGSYPATGTDAGGNFFVLLPALDAERNRRTNHKGLSPAGQWRGAMRKGSYLPLWHLLLKRGMTKSQMRIEAWLTTNAFANMNKGQHISMESLIRICDALDCNLNDVVELVKAEE
jgi:DNA-binding Xre family transcriptional regulator